MEAKDILNGKTCPPELESNLLELVKKVNLLESMCGYKFIVTSGFRDKKDQMRIYNAKGIFDESRMHMTSKHFKCQAVDISDEFGKIKDWINNNVDAVEEIGLWFEDFKSTSNWVHCQTIAPLSGKRFFLP